jgi:hypothetical protein
MEEPFDLGPDRGLGRFMVGPVDGKVGLDLPHERLGDLGEVAVCHPLFGAASEGVVEGDLLS